MQGVVFNALADFVEETAGMAVWNEAIDSSKLLSEGAFTAGQTYPDEDLVTLAIFVANKLELELPDALRAFGKFLFGFLMERGPIEVRDYPNAQKLLEELDGVIHSEVQRLNPEAYTPFFEYVPTSETAGNLTYRSKRKMCVVAEGLIQGAADYYQQQVEMVHDSCVHAGDDDCRWRLTFS